ncbi:hypothetical protein HOJ36_02090 [Candidatus Woesearchaeota archaeon]|nr:hypothetical protein [Candidatus Woesearchaeota archaeon]
MKTKFEKRDVPLAAKYPAEDYDTARKFASKVYKEFGGLIKAVVIFGGQSGNSKKGDIDILIIVDNVSFYLSPEVVETYRIVVGRIAHETSKRLHITTLRFTSFWEYMRMGDPLGVNILRTGIALIDTGFFYPLQIMLYEGRIRPSIESINAYYARSASALNNAQARVLHCALDLYWSVIDSAHAALMRQQLIPPAPKEIHDSVHEKLVKSGQVNRKCPAIMRDFYLLSRKILHKDIKEMKGKELDLWVEKAKFFTKEMKKVKPKH